MSHCLEVDPFGHHRCYIHDDGRTSLSCSDLLSDSPQFSLAKLALFLSRPVLLGEFLPECPWHEITRVCPVFKPPDYQTDAHHLPRLFSESVAECIGDATTVAVVFSGGLDSTAVLLHAAALCKERGGKLFAITADLETDDGRPTSDIAAGLIKQLDIEAELHVVSASFNEKEIMWSPVGPRLDAMPELNYSMAVLAQQLGAEVVLNGSGSDELLGTVRYLLAALLAARRYRGAARYAMSTLHEGAETVVLELLSGISRLLPRRRRAELYWSSNWPELAEPRPSPILAEPYRTFVADWTVDWLRQRMKNHVALQGSWALADAWDSLFPHDVHLPSTELPEHSPFLKPSFAEYAMGLPLTCRYDERFPSDYQRRKSLVMRLIPTAMHAHLPESKMIYSKAFSRYHTAARYSFQRCQELGLFDPDRVHLLQGDSVLLHNASSIETWIRGAEKFGAAAIGL